MQFRANSKDNLDARCNIINLGIRVWSSSLPSLLLEGVRRRGGGITEKFRLWMVSLISFRRVDVERCLKKWNSGKTKDPAIRNSKFYFNCKVPQTSLFKLGGEKGCDQNNRHFVPPPSQVWVTFVKMFADSKKPLIVLSGGFSHCCFALF